MIIPSALWQDMVDHALADSPAECCGMVATKDDRAVKVYRAVNVHPSPPLAYSIDGREQYRIQTEIDDADLDLGIIYHSHTRSDPYPSQTDINLAFYPDALYVIIGVAKAQPEVRAFRIVDSQVQEVALQVE
jgi:proteasome lid subunit RPN8/RPN11